MDNHNNFKNWMDNNYSDSKYKKESVGVEVESKIGLKKLLEKMSAEEGEAGDLANDFLEDGGIVEDTVDKHLLIEVTSGKFYLHRMFVKLLS